MPTRLRRTLLVVAGVQALTALLLIWPPPLVTDIWPLPETTELSFIFLASIAAAAAASLAWACLWGETGSLVGIGLDAMAIFWPLIAWLVLLDPARGGGVTPFLLLAVVTALLFTGLLWYARREPIRDPRPTPRPVLVAFGVFVVALLIVAALLIAGTPNVLPWKVTREAAVLAGIMFLGAAAYFAYGLARPSWANAGGQLAGFLAYDVVLIVPFLTRFPGIRTEWFVSLVLYLAVIVGSALVAVWYLFVVAETRLRRPR